MDQQTLAFFEEVGIDYEVYVLSVDGYYASPERDAASPGVINADAPGSSIIAEISTKCGRRSPKVKYAQTI